MVAFLFGMKTVVQTDQRSSMDCYNPILIQLQFYFYTSILYDFWGEFQRSLLLPAGFLKLRNDNKAGGLRYRAEGPTTLAS